MRESHSLIASSKDEAGLNMVKFLTDVKEFKISNQDPPIYESGKYGNIKLYLTDEELLYLKDFEVGTNNRTSYIFLSKHRSASGIASLTCHTTGNLSQENLYGGAPNELGIAYPSLLKAYYNELFNSRYTAPSYEITLEATHHGPTSLRGPITFVEIGSGPVQWRDWNAARIVCDSILRISSLDLRGSNKIAIALGGTHYPTKLNKILLETDFAIAYIVTKNNLHLVDHVMIQQMIARSAEKITHILLDWKGLGKYKKKVLDSIEPTNLQIVRI